MGRRCGQLVIQHELGEGQEGMDVMGYDSWDATGNQFSA